MHLNTTSWMISRLHGLWRSNWNTRSTMCRPNGHWYELISGKSCYAIAERDIHRKLSVTKNRRTRSDRRQPDWSPPWCHIVLRLVNSSQKYNVIRSCRQLSLNQRYILFTLGRNISYLTTIIIEYVIKYLQYKWHLLNDIYEYVCCMLFRFIVNTWYSRVSNFMH